MKKAGTACSFFNPVSILSSHAQEPLVVPQVNGCIRIQWDGRDAAVPSDAQPHCQGLWNRSCTHSETERGAAASCFERMRWRERKKEESLEFITLRKGVESKSDAWSLAQV